MHKPPQSETCLRVHLLGLSRRHPSNLSIYDDTREHRDTAHPFSEAMDPRLYDDSQWPGLRITIRNLQWIRIYTYCRLGNLHGSANTKLFGTLLCLKPYDYGHTKLFGTLPFLKSYVNRKILTNISDFLHEYTRHNRQKEQSTQ